MIVPIYRRTAAITFSAAWLLALFALFLTDFQSAMLSIGGAVFAAILSSLTWKLVQPPPADREDVLRPTSNGARLRAQQVVAVLTVSWVMLYGWLWGSVSPGGEWMRVPHLTPFFRMLLRTRSPFHDNLVSLFAFTTIVVVPALLLFLFGASRRDLGLTSPTKGTARATLACMSLAVVFAGIGLAKGKVTLAGLGWLLLHNFLSNGLTEEFFARGIVFSHLRRFLRDDWALVVQSLVFALGHFGGTLTDASVHGSAILTIANNVALNAPMGLALGYMALRGRSLVQGTVVHVFLDTMTKTM